MNAKTLPFSPRHGIRVGKDKPAVMPWGPTVERPNSPSEGTFRGNTDTNAMEMYLNGNWVSIGSAGIGIGLPITEDILLEDQGYYEVDTRNNAVTITLDVEPNIGTIFYLLDLKGTWSKNPVTVTGNGQLINGKPEQKQFAVNNSNIQLIYISPEHGWRSLGTTLDAPGWVAADPIAVDFTAKFKYRYPVDTSVASRNITLPPNPKSGDICAFFDLKGTWQLSPVNFKGNLRNIGGSPSDVTVNQPDAVVEFEYVDDTYGWLMKVFAKPKPNSSLASGGVLNGTAVAKANLFYGLDSTSSGFTVSLPDPTTIVNGDTIVFYDPKDSWGKHHITIDPNTGKINGKTASRMLSTAGCIVTFRFENLVFGWVMSVEAMDEHEQFSPRMRGTLSADGIIGESGIYRLDHNAPITLTLPVAAKDFTKVVLIDDSQKLEQHNVTVGAGTNTVNGSLAPYVLRKKGTIITFTFIGGNWVTGVGSSEEILPENKMTLNDRVMSANFDASPLVNYPVDTSLNPVKATAPDSPQPGDTIRFFDYNGTWSENPFIFDRAGQKFEGADLPYEFKRDHQSVELLYVDAATGWKDISSEGDGRTKVSSIVTDGSEIKTGTIYAVTIDPLNPWLKLPSAPFPGDKVTVFDANNEFRQNPLLLDAQSQKIDGMGSTVKFQDTGILIDLEYISQSFGWKAQVVFGDSPRRIVETDRVLRTNDFTSKPNRSYYLGVLADNITVSLPDNPEIGEVVEITDSSRTLGRPYHVTVIDPDNTIMGEAGVDVLDSPGSQCLYEYVGGDQGWQVRNFSDNRDTFPVTPSLTGTAIHSGANFIVEGLDEGKLIVNGNASIGSRLTLEFGNPMRNSTVYITSTGGVKIDGRDEYAMYDRTKKIELIRDYSGWSVSTAHVQIPPSKLESILGQTVAQLNTRHYITDLNEISTIILPSGPSDALEDVWIEIWVDTQDSKTSPASVDLNGSEYKLDRGFDFVRFEHRHGRWFVAHHAPEAELDLSRPVYYHDADDATAIVPSNSTVVKELLTDQNAVIQLGEGYPGETIRLYPAMLPAERTKYIFAGSNGQKIEFNNTHTITGRPFYIEFEYINDDMGWSARATMQDSGFCYKGVKRSDFNAEILGSYLVDTSAEAVVCTLPNWAPEGSRISFKDKEWTFATHPLTLMGTIDGLERNYVSDTPGNYMELIWLDNISQWSFIHNNEVTEEPPLTGALTVSDNEMPDFQNGGVSIFSVDGAATEKTLYMPTGFVPEIGTEIFLHDHNGTWANNPWFLGTTDFRLNGQTEKIRVDTDHGHVYMIYTGSEFGWLVDVHERPEMGVQEFGGNGNINTTSTKTIYAKVNTENGPVVLTSDTSLVRGQRIIFSDAADTFHKNPLTWKTGGVPIDGQAGDLVIQRHGYVGEFMYINSTVGWKLLYQRADRAVDDYEGHVDEMGSMEPVRNMTYRLVKDANDANKYYTLVLPAQPEANYEFWLTTDLDIYEDNEVKLQAVNHTINGQSTRRLVRNDISYHIRFTGIEWDVVEQPKGYVDEVSVSHVPYFRLYRKTPLQFTGGDMAIVGKTDEVNPFTITNPTTILLGKPVAGERIAFFDSNGGLSEENSLKIRGVSDVLGINTPNNEIEFNLPYTYVELEWNELTSLYTVVIKTPDAPFDVTHIRSAITGDTVAAPNSFYMLSTPFGGSYTVTLPTGAPEGSRVYFSANGNTYSNEDNIHIEAVDGIDGKPSANGFVRTLRSGPMSVTFLRANGSWITESEIIDPNHVDVTVDDTPADNILVQNARHTLKALSGAVVALPEHVSPGTWVEVEINPTEANEAAFTILADNGGVGDSWVLADKSRVMRFVFTGEQWLSSTTLRNGGPLSGATITANATVMPGSVNNIDTTNGAVEVTLPEISKLFGTVRVVVQDVGGKAGTNAIQVVPSDGTIQNGAVEVLNQNGAWVELTRFDGANYWVVTGRYPPKDISLPQMAHSAVDTNFATIPWNSYTVTSETVTEVTINPGAPGDIMAIKLERDVYTPVRFTGSPVNNGDVVSIHNDGVYYFEFVEGFGWLMKTFAINRNLLENVSQTTSQAGEEKLVAVEPGKQYELGASVGGSRIIATIDASSFADKQMAEFIVRGNANGHMIVRPAAGTYIDGSEGYLVLQAGDWARLEYDRLTSSFTIKKYVQRLREAGAGMSPANENDAVIPTLGLVNYPNVLIAGKNRFALDASWPVGTVVTIGDPFQELDYVNRVIVISAPAGFTIDGDTEYTISRPGDVFKFVLSGTDWKVASLGQRVTTQVDVLGDMPLQPDADHNIGVLTASATLTLPDVSDQATDVFVNIVDTTNAAGSHPVKIKCPNGVTFHNGETELTLNVAFGYIALRYRRVSSTWVIMHEPVVASSGEGGGGTYLLPQSSLSENIVAEVGKHYIKTPESNVILTLPNDAVPGDVVRASIRSNNRGRTLTINGNGKVFTAYPNHANLVFNASHRSITLVFGANDQWEVYELTGKYGIEHLGGMTGSWDPVAQPNIEYVLTGIDGEIEIPRYMYTHGEKIRFRFDVEQWSRLTLNCIDGLHDGEYVYSQLVLEDTGATYDFTYDGTCGLWLMEKVHTLAISRPLVEAIPGTVLDGQTYDYTVNHYGGAMVTFVKGVNREVSKRKTIELKQTADFEFGSVLEKQVGDANQMLVKTDGLFGNSNAAIRPIPGGTGVRMKGAADAPALEFFKPDFEFPAITDVVVLDDNVEHGAENARYIVGPGANNNIILKPNADFRDGNVIVVADPNNYLVGKKVTLMVAVGDSVEGSQSYEMADRGGEWTFYYSDNVWTLISYSNSYAGEPTLTYASVTANPQVLDSPILQAGRVSVVNDGPGNYVRLPEDPSNGTWIDLLLERPNSYDAMATTGGLTVVPQGDDDFVAFQGYYDIGNFAVRTRFMFDSGRWHISTSYANGHEQLSLWNVAGADYPTKELTAALDTDVTVAITEDFSVKLPNVTKVFNHAVRLIVRRTGAGKLTISPQAPGKLNDHESIVLSGDYAFAEFVCVNSMWSVVNTSPDVIKKGDFINYEVIELLGNIVELKAKFSYHFKVGNVAGSTLKLPANPIKGDFVTINAVNRFARDVFIEGNGKQIKLGDMTLSNFGVMNSHMKDVTLVWNASDDVWETNYLFADQYVEMPFHMAADGVYPGTVYSLEVGFDMTANFDIAGKGMVRPGDKVIVISNGDVSNTNQVLATGPVGSVDATEYRFLGYGYWEFTWTGEFWRIEDKTTSFSQPERFLKRVNIDYNVLSWVGRTTTRILEANTHLVIRNPYNNRRNAAFIELEPPQAFGPFAVTVNRESNIVAGFTSNAVSGLHDIILYPGDILVGEVVKDYINGQPSVVTIDKIVRGSNHQRDMVLTVPAAEASVPSPISRGVVNTSEDSHEFIMPLTYDGTIVRVGPVVDTKVLSLKGEDISITVEGQQTFNISTPGVVYEFEFNGTTNNYRLMKTVGWSKDNTGGGSGAGLDYVVLDVADNVSEQPLEVNTYYGLRISSIGASTLVLPEGKDGAVVQFKILSNDLAGDVKVKAVSAGIKLHSKSGLTATTEVSYPSDALERMYVYSEDDSLWHDITSASPDGNVVGIDDADRHIVGAVILNRTDNGGTAKGVVLPKGQAGDTITVVNSHANALTMVAGKIGTTSASEQTLSGIGSVVYRHNGLYWMVDELFDTIHRGRGWNVEELTFDGATMSTLDPTDAPPLQKNASPWTRYRFYNDSTAQGIPMALILPVNYMLPFGTDGTKVKFEVELTSTYVPVVTTPSSMRFVNGGNSVAVLPGQSVVFERIQNDNSGVNEWTCTVESSVIPDGANRYSMPLCADGAEVKPFAGLINDRPVEADSVVYLIEDTDFVDGQVLMFGTYGAGRYGNASIMLKSTTMTFDTDEPVGPSPEVIVDPNCVTYFMRKGSRWVRFNIAGGGSGGSNVAPPVELGAVSGPLTLDYTSGNVLTTMDISGNVAIDDIMADSTTMPVEFLIIATVVTDNVGISFPPPVNGWYAISGPSEITGLVTGDVVTVQGHIWKGKKYYSFAKHFI